MNDGDRFTPVPATRRTFLASAGALVGLSAACAGEDGQGGSEPPDESKERLLAMRRLAQRVKLVVTADDKPGGPVPLRDDPLHRYGNRSFGILDGTVWAWGERGRPPAIMKVEFWPDRDEGRGRWSFGVCASSTRRIEAVFADGLSWSSRPPGTESVAVPDAPEPADEPARRLAQAKAISRRLSAHGEHPRVSGRINLRLLTTPIDRYADPEAGLLDGSTFAFVNATNPEFFVFIEVWAQGSGAPSWRYGFVRQSTAALAVLDQGKAVWTIPYAPPPSNTETYMNRSMPKGVEAP